MILRIGVCVGAGIMFNIAVAAGGAYDCGFADHNNATITPNNTKAKRMDPMITLILKIFLIEYLMMILRRHQEERKPKDNVNRQEFSAFQPI